MKLPDKFFIDLSGGNNHAAVSAKLVALGYKWNARRSSQHLPQPRVILTGRWDGPDEAKSIRGQHEKSPIPYGNDWTKEGYVELDENLNLKQTKEKMKIDTICTAYTPGLEAFAREILGRKGIELFVERGGENKNSLYLNCYQKVGVGYQTPEYLVDNSRYTEVSSLEFIKVLEESFPDKVKEFRTTLGTNRLKTEVTDKYVRVGCQEYSPVQFQQIEDAVKSIRKGITVAIPGRESITVHANSTITAAGSRFNFADFDLIAKEFSKLQK